MQSIGVLFKDGGRGRLCTLSRKRPQAGEGVVSIPEEVRGSEEVAREKFKFLLSPAAWPRPLKAPSPACGGRVGVGELAVETTPQPFTSSNSTSNISVAFGGMAPPAPRAP